MPERTPFPGQVPRGSKPEGANLPGEHGGLYTNEKGEVSLFKLDTKDGKPRVAKVIGEGMASMMIRRIASYTGLSQDVVASVRFVRAYGDERPGVDEEGGETYIQSKFISGYQDDFWRFANQKKFESEYAHELSKVDVYNQKMVTKYAQHYYAKMADYYLLRIKNSNRLNKVAEAKVWQKKLTKLKVINFERQVRASQTFLIKRLVEADMYQTKRVSTVFSFSARKLVNSTLQHRAHPDFLKQFAALTAPRLLIGDFGVHYGNFGVAKQNGKLVLAGLDYGAAFAHLHPKVHVYSRLKSGAHRFLNHFAEYDYSVSASEDMALEFIKIGYAPRDFINDVINEAVREAEAHYGLSPLKKFCQRLGLKSREYATIDNKDALITIIKNFMAERLHSRKLSMRDQGFSLLLERCVNKKTGELLMDKIANLSTGDYLAQQLGYTAVEQDRDARGQPSNEQLRQNFLAFVNGNGFKKTDLVLFHSFFPGRETKLKERLRHAVLAQQPVLQAGDAHSCSQVVEEYRQQIMHISSASDTQAAKLASVTAIENKVQQLQARMLPLAQHGDTAMQENLTKLGRLMLKIAEQKRVLSRVETEIEVKWIRVMQRLFSPSTPVPPTSHKKRKHAPRA